MHYIHNHPSKDFARALKMDKKAQARIENAIAKAYDGAIPVNGTLAFDDFVAGVAPYIHTPEEGFYAAITMFSQIEAAKYIVYSKKN